MTVEADIEHLPDVYLRAFLEPLAPWLARMDITEILCNRPGEIWVEGAGHGLMQRHAVPALNDRHIQRLAGQIARINHQGINREHPLLAATLPTGERVQIVGPPATRQHWAFAIRKHVIQDVCIEDFAPAGGFAEVQVGSLAGARRMDAALRARARSGDMAGFLREAVGLRKSILISGGTSTGKTSLLNALLSEIPDTERIIAVEDTPEVRLVHANALGLISVKGALGQARITADDLLQASLRMRPDRIVVGEIRGSEAATFLRAINTGHPGSITTLHADSPLGALEQVALMVLQSGLGLSRADTIAYVRSIIDIVIQLEKRAGRRGIAQVMFTQDEDDTL